MNSEIKFSNDLIYNPLYGILMISSSFGNTGKRALIISKDSIEFINVKIICHGSKLVTDLFVK